VNLQFEKADLGSIVARNIFHISGAVLTLIIGIILFMDPDFQEITGFMEYSQFAAQFKAGSYVNWGVSLITIVDAIMLVADDRKRSLHDRIGNTYVIRE
jgi:hypothetical protein